MRTTNFDERPSLLHPKIQGSQLLMSQAASMKAIENNQVEVSQHCCHGWHILRVEVLHLHRITRVRQRYIPKRIEASHLI